MMKEDKGNGLGESAVLAALTTNWLGQVYHYEDEIGSTNVQLRDMAAQGAAHGTVLLANYQAQGKGRLGRQWEAPPGSALLLSVLLRVPWPPEQLAWATMLASVAMAEAVEAVTGLSVRLKWPNDLLVQVDGEWRKTCGILAELVTGAEGGETAVIIGSGVNVNLAATALPSGHTTATSLMLAHGQPVSRLALLVAYLERLEKGVEAAVSDVSPLGAWAKRLVTIGQPVTVTNIGQNKQVVGVAEAVNECGQLLVRDAAGTLHVMHSGDVTLRRR